MRLYRIHLNPRGKEARRDLADPYQMHATLCRAFFPAESPCPAGALLWRLEPETDREGHPRILIQSNVTPDWSRVPVGWLAYGADPGIDLAHDLALDRLIEGRRFRFRLRANPCKTINGKRLGLMSQDGQRNWLERKASRHGFHLVEPDSTDNFDLRKQGSPSAFQNFRMTQEQMLTARQHAGNVIRIFSVLYEGMLSVANPSMFKQALADGIGHGKAFGLGLLSILPVN